MLTVSRILLTLYPKATHGGTVNGGFSYSQWRTKDREFPCLFAKTIARSLGPDAVWFRDCRSTAAGQIASDINALVEAGVRSGSAKVLSIHIPAWTELLMAETMVALSAHDGWELNILPTNPRVAGVRVGLHRILRSETTGSLAIDTVPMVLGPFPQLPPSRRCPEPIFEVSVDPTCVASKLRGGRHRSDFLALPTPKLNKKQFEGVKKQVEENTKHVNGGKDLRAHPDVTVTISSEFAGVFNG